MRYIILSQPKSGTYLCSNILRNMGIHQPWMHIDRSGYTHTDPNKIGMDECRKNPGKYKTRMSIAECLELIKEDEFAVGHLAHDARLETLLTDFKKIVLHRDSTEAAVSYNRMLVEYRKKPGNKKTVPNNVSGWMKRPDCFVMNFDSMINQDTTKIDELQTYLFNEIKFDSAEVLTKSLEEDSPTKSSIRQ